MSNSELIKPTTIKPASLWRSSETDLEQFTWRLPASEFATLIEAAQLSLDEGRPTDSLTADDLPLGRLAKQVAELRHELCQGSGFALVEGLPLDGMETAMVERIFWGLGVQLGTPVSQSVMGERLGHVTDVTADDPNARAYRNKSELTPHTDPADLLTFLCINPAASGGVSRFVSSMTIHEEIRRRRPDLLERLYRGYRYHRGGENRPGSATITPHRVPVFSHHQGFTSCRYVRHYIEVAAAEDNSISLDDLDREAFDLLEQLAADPALHFEFVLQPGQAVFANNFTVMHARSGFENDPDMPPRLLLRLWLSTTPRRPVTPDIAHFEGEPGIPPVEGRTPSYATDVDIQ